MYQVLFLSPRASLEAWVLGASAMSVLLCTGGGTAEHAQGLFSYQCCVRASLYRGRDCRTCSGVVQLPVLCPCFFVQGAPGTAEHSLGLFSCLCETGPQTHKNKKLKRTKIVNNTKHADSFCGNTFLIQQTEK